MSHVMPELDGRILRRLCSLGEVEPLPDKLEAAYWELKRCYDRIGLVLTSRELAVLCFMQGYGQPNQQELAPPSIVTLWKTKQVKFDDPVKVQWRNGVKNAVLKGVDGNSQVIVQLEGDATEKKVPADKVSVAA